eukprot:PITA_11290
MFVLVARMERTMVEILAQHKWKVYQMDVKSTFLNRVLKEEVYVAQPPCYEVEGQEDKVYRLRKALYGLKQAPGNDDFLIVDFKEVIKSEFEMTDLGLLRYFLGIEVKQTTNDIFISQGKYVANILERFKMHTNKPAPSPIVMGLKFGKEDCSSNFNLTLYKSMINSLMYLTATKLDIMYAVSFVSRFMEIPKKMHSQGAKSYKVCQRDKGVWYFICRTNNFKLVGYANSG